MKNHAAHHKDIADILGSVRDRDHYTVIRDFFELSAISIRNNFDHGNEFANLEKRYKEIAQGYKKEYLEGFATALGMLGKKIQDAVNGNAPFTCVAEFEKTQLMAASVGATKKTSKERLYYNGSPTEYRDLMGSDYAPKVEQTSLF